VLIARQCSQLNFAQGKSSRLLTRGLKWANLCNGHKTAVVVDKRDISGIIRKSNTVVRLLYTVVLPHFLCVQLIVTLLGGGAPTVYCMLTIVFQQPAGHMNSFS